MLNDTATRLKRGLSVESFKGDFPKLFKLEQNPLNETQSEIQLAKI